MDNVNEYQLKAHGFSEYGKPFVTGKQGCVKCDYCYPVMGLAEEAGEVAGKFAKALRDNNGIITDERKEEIIKELGDVTWFVAEICTLLDVGMGEVMQRNIEKLTSRKNRNVIHGSGDDR